MKLSKYICLLLTTMPLIAGAQQIKSGYVDKGVCGSAFPQALKSWEKGQKWCEDDNFFISRVRPHQRFRNEATQVNPLLNEDNDKKLIFWVPANNEEFNALPDGVFDSEVFPMWSYITHYGNWSARLVRVPAGFLDVAHKNGVPVSALASIPYGNIAKEWKEALTELTEVGPEKLADYLLYYGVDGIGYNSEFNGPASLVSDLCDLHEKTVKLMKEAGGNPEFIWYDGTNKDGRITFDRGLADHNKDLWGYGDAVRSSLFLNYNWNSKSLLEKTVSNAEKYGRTPLDIYCGINMQGREPHNGKDIWTIMEQYPVSIGLWGAHSENMFFESRAEQGSSPMRHQRTYFDRMLNWFTNGSHNPIASHATSNSLVYSAKNNDFFGMSKMMSARSALKWNLSDEPFITYFNLSNGLFFNWRGERCHNSEWYNIAAQDYLPTWMWWFASKFLGRNDSDIVEGGLKADFVWDDAWIGGSTIRVAGSSPEEYLHLFKTEFPLQAGDEIIFRFKQLNGSADAFIAMSLKGDEENPISEGSMQVMDSSSPCIPGEWIEKKFIVGRDVALSDGSEVAMIALHFRNASDLDMRFGEFSIKRPSALKNTLDAPVVESTALLSARHNGVDGKIIFNMPNEKGNDICYNSDVNTSLFKLYFQQDNQPVLMGITTSWAGLIYSAPYKVSGVGKVRFGVSSLAVGHETESPICWGEWQSVDDVYSISDEILLNKNIIKPNEPFMAYYSDMKHEDADWTLNDAAGNMVKEYKGTNSFVMYDGLPAPGIYDLTVKGFECVDSSRVETTRLLKGFVQVSDESAGDIPNITSIAIPGSEILDIDTPDEVYTHYNLNSREPKIEYSLDPGNAVMSRGVCIGDNGLGFRFKDTGMAEYESFGVSFWFKPESFSHKSVHALNIRHKGDPWSVNNWGWFWHTLSESGRSAEFTIRMASGKNASYRFDGMKLIPGAWYHIGYSFEFDEEGGVLPALFVNGEKQPITSWSLGDKVQDGKVDFVGPVWGWKEDNVVALGGYLHKTGSVRGNADNFMVWSKALSEEDMKLAMGDVSEDALPDGIVGFFNFEDGPDADGLFDNLGVGSFKVGIHGYIDTEVEGQGVLEWREPEFCTGCPFTSGKAFEMTPKVSWDTPGAVVKENIDNGSEGYVWLSYPESDSDIGGHYVRLSVENEYGFNEREMLLFLNGEDGVSTVFSESDFYVRPRVFDSEINVRTAAEGYIVLSLYTLDGKCVLSNAFNAAATDILCLRPEVSSGIYILKAEKNGIVLGTLKLIRR